MALALKKAGLSSEEMDLVSAHGTSTPLGDVHETMALKRVFGAHAYRVPIRVALSNSFGFGGHNVALVFKALS